MSEPEALSDEQIDALADSADWPRAILAPTIRAKLRQFARAIERAVQAETAPSVAKDAERYRWLRNRAWGVPIQNSLAYTIEFPTFTHVWSGDMKDFSNIDDAIDRAAMAPSGETE